MASKVSGVRGLDLPYISKISSDLVQNVQYCVVPMINCLVSSVCINKHLCHIFCLQVRHRIIWCAISVYSTNWSKKQYSESCDMKK